MIPAVMRASPLRPLVVLALLVTGAGCQAGNPRTSAPEVRDVEWRTYGGTYASARYSPLAQIDRDNVGRLRVAWRWRSPDHDVMARDSLVETFVNEATPVMVGGVLYVSTSLSQVAAIDAATGQTLWVHDPEVWRMSTPPNHGWVHRGVAHWTDGREERIFIGTGNAFLIALDARTGQPIPSFGNAGRIDLTEGLGRPVSRLLYSVTSPPVVVRDVVVVGASILDLPVRRDMPPGHVRGFDARTGQVRWIFHAIPQAGEAGNETWEQESWKTAGGANVWAPMSADEDLGYVYLPFSTPANDYYGGHRHGDNLFAESLVCLDAATGRRVWHYQVVRHGLWDYDLPAAPNLADVTVNGRHVKAVAQVTKQGFVFVFDRVTGRPLWPIEDRPVPQSTVPGEKTAGGANVWAPMSADEELGYAYLPLSTPANDYYGGRRHGDNLFGESLVCVDAATGRRVWHYQVVRHGVWDYDLPAAPNLAATTGGRSTRRPASAGRSSCRAWRAARAGPAPPSIPPPAPFGRMVAIDLNTGEHAWTVPLGEGPRKHPRLAALDLPRLGWARRGFPLVTGTLLFAAQEGRLIAVRPPKDRAWSRIVTVAIDDPALEVFDKASGALLARIELPANAQGALMTYMVRGRQYIVVPVGGANLPAELVALTLP